MPIYLKMCMRQGWKPYQNNRFGEVLEMQFINTDNDQIMFRYAPKLDDEVKFNDMFKLLFELDSKYKELKEILKKIEERPKKWGFKK